MRHWREFTSAKQVREHFQPVLNRIRSGELDLGRPRYALSLAYGVMQAIHCGYDAISAIEFGVGGGGGLLDLCKAARFFRHEFALDISVFGFDNATGLPPPMDYRDHPEIWRAGAFKLPSAQQLSLELPDYARLIIGEIGETMADFTTHITSPLAFVSIDVDYYSSCVACLKAFDLGPECYVPAVPVYFDEIDMLLTFSDRCGERLAIKEFNDRSAHRSIEQKPEYNIRQFHVCHILDHPLRNGKPPRIPFFLWPL